MRRSPAKRYVSFDGAGIKRRKAIDVGVPSSIEEFAVFIDGMGSRKNRTVSGTCFVFYLLDSRTYILFSNVVFFSFAGTFD